MGQPEVGSVVLHHSGAATQLPQPHEIADLLGELTVEEDLVEALNSGKLKGYGGDVWYSDPPPDDCPVLTAPNVVMTPHLGASSKENLLRIGDIIEEKIAEYAKNK